ncbi:hypothetical protein Syun_021927 [Stephania yunnanensis]|uniref:Uncharacterized protein n=1 Tax=Stephania yunnanensis TaxID=152371 RepID=A0AAP0IGZ3_9MAGN
MRVAQMKKGIKHIKMIDMINYRSSSEQVGGGHNQIQKQKEYMGIPIHNQIRKIKQEHEKIRDPTPPEEEEMRYRPVLREITRQLSRSPLGRSGRPISVGDS